MAAVRRRRRRGQCLVWLALGKDWSPGWVFLPGLWLGLGLAADLVFGLTAWWQLRTRFRELALRRFNPAPSPFARWFGLGSPERAGPARADIPATRSSAPKIRLRKPRDWRTDARREDKRSGISVRSRVSAVKDALE